MYNTGFAVLIELINDDALISHQCYTVYINYIYILYTYIIESLQIWALYFYISADFIICYHYSLFW